MAVAQTTTISGTVLCAESNDPLAGAMAICSADSVTIAYTVTKGDGSFAIAAKPNDRLTIRCLGYKTQTIVIDTTEPLTILLHSDAIAIKEVAVKADKVKWRNDTVTYNVASFAADADVSIGDVMARMPGMTVDADGRIRYNGSAIDHFYIEGIDLLEGRYNLATNNISHSDVARVEVLQNHQPIRALRSSNRHNGTAINLKLKDKALLQWHGHLHAAAGNSIAQAELFAMLFRKSFQNISTLKANNSGTTTDAENAVLTIDDLMREADNTADTEPPISINPELPAELPACAATFNTSACASASSAWKTQGAEVRCQAVLGHDEASYHTAERIAYIDNHTEHAYASSTETQSTTNSIELSHVATRNAHNAFLTSDTRLNGRWFCQRQNNIGDYSNSLSANGATLSIDNRLQGIKPHGTGCNEWLSHLRLVSQPTRCAITNGTECQRDTTLAQSALYTARIKNERTWRGCVWRVATEGEALHLRQYGTRIGSLTAKATPSVELRRNETKLLISIPVCAVAHTLNGNKSTHLDARADVSLRWQPSACISSALKLSYGNRPRSLAHCYTDTIITGHNTRSTGTLRTGANRVTQASANIGYSNPITLTFANITTWYAKRTGGIQAKRLISDGQFVSHLSPSDKAAQTFALSAEMSKGALRSNATASARYELNIGLRTVEQNGCRANYRTTSHLWEIKTQWTPARWLSASTSHTAQTDTYCAWGTRQQIWQLSNRASASISPIGNLSVRLSASALSNASVPNRTRTLTTIDAKARYSWRRIDVWIEATNLTNRTTYAQTSNSDMITTQSTIKLRPFHASAGIKMNF